MYANFFKVGITEFGPNRKVRIKITVDGAKMTRFTNFIVMSFSMLDSDDVMSSKGTICNIVSK